jgi:protein involved in polysaccharide export with SLBB domain
MRVADLIRAGGNLAPSAYGGRAELSRFTVEQGERRRTEIINIDLAAVARGDETANVLLNPYDALSVKEIPDWDSQDQVILTGEVRLPGAYAIRRGETLRSVIQRAGGLTDLAFPAGAVFTRDELRDREQEELDRLAERMRSDIASMALMAARVGQSLNANSEYNIGQSLLTQIKATKAMGRLVINLNAAIHAAPGTSDDIALRGGDQLAIPRLRQEVMVMGEVQSASSHLFGPELTRDDYIAQSGGFTSQGDHKRVYVVHADGSVVPTGRHWLVGFGGEAIRPGDTVVVPLDTERLPRLPLWQAVTQILYNIAISSAAISRL